MANAGTGSRTNANTGMFKPQGQNKPCKPQHGTTGQAKAGGPAPDGPGAGKPPAFRGGNDRG